MGMLFKIEQNPADIEKLKKHNFVLTERNIKKGNGPAPHWHDYFEFELIVEGSATHYLNNGVITLGKGDAYLLSSLDLHTLTFESDVKLINLRFGEGLLSHRLNDLMLSMSGISCHFNSHELSYVLSRLDRLKAEQAADRVFCAEISTNIISEIIYMIIRKFTKHEKPELPSTVQRAMTYMLKNFRFDISLISAAEQISVTPKYLGSLFKESVGVTFHEYLNNLRLKYACSLLWSTDMTAKEIAFSAGYNSVEHFMYTFKKRFFMTPTEYRKLNK
ncbi:MAG: helix-turn-helix domain-containing protein [Ruminococcaceae bacterium]|nr:helix-turn-helix domain-containing protein [Oscillospiraceae bacterium]